MKLMRYLNTKNIIAAGVLLSCMSSIAWGAIIPDRTRIIMNESDKGEALKLTNQSKNLPYLAQTWIEDTKGNKSRDFIVTVPPMVRLNPSEPGLWIDEKLVDALHHEGKYVCIETNGTCLLPENIDWVTCSPKEGAKINLDRIDEVKVVYVGQDVSAYLDLSASHYFLQPCSCANTEEVIAYILQHPEWRLSLQTHKLLQIP